MSSALFDFTQNIKKGADFLSSFQKVIICELAGIFGAQKSQESRLFCFEKGRWLSAPDSRPFSCFREDGFFVFYEQAPTPEKGRRRKWRSKVKNPNQASSKTNRTRPEYRSHTGPPARTEKPVCMASLLCEGCPFPGHGFLCRGEDGECMRTRLMKLSEKEEEPK